MRVGAPLVAQVAAQRGLVVDEHHLAPAAAAAMAPQHAGRAAADDGHVRAGELVRVAIGHRGRPGRDLAQPGDAPDQGLVQAATGARGRMNVL